MNLFTIKKNKESGFVILFAMLISTLILLMSAGIFRVAQKESILSSYSRESQKAFYAADAGAECALYWDISSVIAVTRFNTLTANESFTDPFECGTDADSLPRQINAFKYGVTGVYDHVFGFRFANLDTDLGCAFVFVEKNNSAPPVDPLDPPSPKETRITSVGYNVCTDDVPDLDDPTLLERRLSVQYFGN